LKISKIKRNYCTSTNETVPKIFGVNVFNESKFEGKLPSGVYKKYKKIC